jgi:hypothetical protein
MKTTKQLQKIANDVIADSAEWPSDVRYEVLEELIRCAASDEELTKSETSQLFDLVSARV